MCVASRLKRRHRDTTAQRSTGWHCHCTLQRGSSRCKTYSSRMIHTERMLLEWCSLLRLYRWDSDRARNRYLVGRHNTSQNLFQSIDSKSRHGRPYCNALSSRIDFPEYMALLRNITNGNFSCVYTCRAEVRGALWGSGNPEISGIGTAFGYLLESSICASLICVYL
jgi:hypothetical protein